MLPSRLFAFRPLADLSSRLVLSASLLALGTALPAAAQEIPGSSVAQGVLNFQSSFFAEARPNTALDMIGRLPGFSFNPGDSGTRGYAGAGGNVLINGQRPSIKSESLEAVLRRISAASVERIELIRGGAPGIDMQGQAVVANIILVRQVTQERVLETNAYFYPDGYVGPLITGSWSRRDGDQLLEASLSGTTDRTDGTGDGYRRRYDAAGTLTQDADLVLWDRFRNVRATGGWQDRMLGGLIKVNGLLSWNDHAFEQDVLIRSGAGSDSTTNQDQGSLSGELGVNYSRDLSDRLGLELVGLQRLNDETYVGESVTGGNSSRFSSDSLAGESIGRAVLRYRLNDRWAFESGAELAWNVLDSDTTYAENGAAVPLPNASVRVEELRGEAFGQGTWQYSDSLTIEAGLRVEVSEISQSGDTNLSKTFTYPKPRLMLTWSPAPGHQFRARMEREVGQLDFGDFVASADINIGQVEGGNADLEPYKAWIYEGVYERRFWERGVFEFSLTHADVEDMVDIIPLTGGFDGVGNIGDGRQDVVQARLTLPLDNLGLANTLLKVRGTWNHTRVTDPVTGEARAFQGDQSFGCGVDLTQDLRGGRWSWGLQHGCNIDRGQIWRVREVRDLYAEPFVTLWGQWKPNTNTTVRVDLGNVTDRANGYDRDLYAGPRDIAPIIQHEVRRTWMSPWLFLQVRTKF